MHGNRHSTRPSCRALAHPLDRGEKHGHLSHFAYLLQTKATARHTFTKPPTYRIKCKIPEGVYSPPPFCFYLALTMSTLQSSPTKHTQNSGRKYDAVGPPSAKKLYNDLDEEMRRHFVGPVPVEVFFQTILPPYQLSQEEEAALQGYEGTANARGEREEEMYDRFVRPFHFTASFASLIVVRSIPQTHTVTKSKRTTHRVTRVSNPTRGTSQTLYSTTPTKTTPKAHTSPPSGG